MFFFTFFSLHFFHHLSLCAVCCSHTIHAMFVTNKSLCTMVVHTQSVKFVAHAPIHMMFVTHTSLHMMFVAQIPFHVIFVAHIPLHMMFVAHTSLHMMIVALTPFNMMFVSHIPLHVMFVVHTPLHIFVAHIPLHMIFHKICVVKFRESGELLSGRKFLLRLKWAVYESYVRPTIPYGSETWRLKESEMGILGRTERSMV